MKILIIDDEPELCAALVDFFNILKEFNAEALDDSRKAIDKLRTEPYDLVISDVRMPYLSGVDIARQIKGENIDVPIILISGQEDVINSINALDLGIHDFLVKPLDMKKLLEMVRALKDKKKSTQPLLEFSNIIKQKEIFLNEISYPSSLYLRNSFIGTVVLASEFMHTLLKKIIKIAQFPDIPVLIQGPTGTGKEVVARLIHYFSPHKTEAFVPVNCAAIEKNLFESELFGYNKGAFTGADPNGRDGKIKAARGGSLFLDEITEISLDLQTKLLRVLQEKEYYKIGSNVPDKVETKIICATNRNIQKMVKNQEFREDLYYRLDVCKLNLLPLSQRITEIAPLAMMLIKEIASSHGLDIKKFDSKIFTLLEHYHWPGNIRQLRNTITKAMLFCEGEILVPDDFSFLKAAEKGETNYLDSENFKIPDKSFSLEQYADRILYKVLHKFKGNKSKSAEFLGLERHQLYYRYKKVIDQFDRDFPTV